MKIFLATLLALSTCLLFAANHSIDDVNDSDVFITIHTLGQPIERIKLDATDIQRLRNHLSKKVTLPRCIIKQKTVTSLEDDACSPFSYGQLYSEGSYIEDKWREYSVCAVYD